MADLLKKRLSFIKENIYATLEMKVFSGFFDDRIGLKGSKTYKRMEYIKES